jgi:uncharacterized protein
LTAEILLYITTGVFAGFLCGLTGLGGGIFIVPTLLYIFPHHAPQLANASCSHFAIATSLTTVIFTAATSAIFHHKNGNIVCSALYRYLPYGILGAAIGANIAISLPSFWLSKAFNTFLILYALRMLSKVIKTYIGCKAPTPKQKSNYFVNTYVSCIAALSNIFGIAGGPIYAAGLTQKGMSLKQGIGTGIAISVFAATTGAIIYGFIDPLIHHTANPAWASGYIYWPSVLFIAPFSVAFAPLGTKLANHLSSQTIKLIFGCILLAVGIISIFY